MAYVEITARGGMEEDRDRVRDVLASHFEDGWGEVAVELTFDGTRWRVDQASWKAAGASLRLDCRDQVVTALAVARIGFHRPPNPASPFPESRAKLW